METKTIKVEKKEIDILIAKIDKMLSDIKEIKKIISEKENENYYIIQSYIPDIYWKKIE